MSRITPLILDTATPDRAAVWHDVFADHAITNMRATLPIRRWR